MKAPSPTTTRPEGSAPTRPAMGHVSDMDLRLLQVFHTIVSCGGMGAAAHELNLGPPAISRHLKDLETRLGLVLCRRGRAGFALTSEGQRVFEEAQRLLLAVEAFRSGVHDIHARMEGQLALALFDKTVSNPASQLTEALADFRRMAPDVHLHVHIGSIAHIEQGVMDNRFQVGILPFHREVNHLHYADLFSERMCLYGARGHALFDRLGAIEWDEVKRHPFAGLGYQSPNMDWSHRHHLERRATGYDQEAIASLILSGEFLGFLPDHYAEPWVQQGRLRALAPETLDYTCRFAAIWREPMGRAARCLLQCLRARHGGEGVRV